jgi:hypothetical protein
MCPARGSSVRGAEKIAEGLMKNSRNFFARAGAFTLCSIGKIRGSVRGVFGRFNSIVPGCKKHGIFPGFDKAPVKICAVITLGLLLTSVAIAEHIYLTPPKNLFTPNTTINAEGRPGEVLVLLGGGPSITNILTPSATTLATAVVGRAASASFTFSTAGTNNSEFFKVLVSTNWSPPPGLPSEYGLKILSLPADQIAPTNGSAIFMIDVQPINTNDVVTYQWLKNDVSILGASGPSLLLTNVSTNIDVGFYACDVRAGTNPVYRARGRDWEAPGARLFVYAGTNTPCTGPYQPSYPGSSLFCDGVWTTYIGWVQFVNPEPGPLYGTTYFMAPPGRTTCTAVDKTSGIGSYTSRIYVRETSSRPPICDTSPLSVSSIQQPPRYYQFTVFVLAPSEIAAIDLSRKITLDVMWGP